MSAGRIAGLPGGQGLDIVNRVARSIAHAHLATEAIPIADAYISFDTPYAGIKKIHHLVMVCIVRATIAEKYYAALEESLFKQYGLDFDIARTIQHPTRHLGSHYCLENPEVDAVYRTYILWRSENERPSGAQVVDHE